MAVQVGETAQSSGYAALFKQYIVRSVEACLAQIDRDEPVAPAVVPAEVRELAWHVLGFAFNLDEAWAPVRKLLFFLSPRLEQEGFWDEWIPYLHQGIAASRRLGDREAEAQLSLYLGRIYRKRSDFAGARMWLSASIECCRITDNHQIEGAALIQLAYVAHLQNRPGEAKENVDDALALLDEDAVERAAAHFVLGQIAEDALDWATAESHHRLAYAIYLQHGDRIRTAWSMQNISLALRGQARYTEAIRFSQQAITLLEEANDSASAAIGRMNLGIIYSLQGESQKALTMYDLAETAFRRVFDTLHLAKVNNNKAIEYRNLKQWSQAERCARRSVELWEALGDAKSLINTLDELGLAYAGQGRYREAIAVYERGLDLLQEVEPGPAYDQLHAWLAEHLAEAKTNGDSGVIARPAETERSAGIP